MKPDQPTLEMERVPSREVAHADRTDPVQMVLDAARDPQVDVAKVRELLAMRKELQAEFAKQQFDRAFAAFQAECPVIQKTRAVPDNSGNTAYVYAPLEHIATTIKPFLEKHGFSYTYDTDVQSEVGWVIARCIVTHADGHSKETKAKFPLGAGTRMMSATQIYAAALTFASRRVLTNAFGLTLAGEDLDGRTGQGMTAKGPSNMAADDPTVDDMRKELWTLLPNSVKGVKEQWKDGKPTWDLANRWLIDECVLSPDESAPNFSAARFREVINKVIPKLKGKR